MVIIGAGFGGLNAALQLRNAPVEVIVIDRRNYHLFQPLLYQVATAFLSPAQIATPIRHILSRQKNALVLMERVIGIDRERREVVTDMSRIAFDYLIIATGARHHYFGNEAWETIAPGLKKIDEATEIRSRILTAFELAEASFDGEERRRHPDVCRGRRRPDGRRDGWSDRRARPARGGARFPPDRHCATPASS